MAKEPHDLALDPAIRDWVLIPIMIVMVLIGVLRHYITLLLQSPGKTNLKAIREAQALTRARVLRSSCNSIPYFAFDTRRQKLGDRMKNGEYVAKPVSQPGTDGQDQQQPPNPMGDPAQMDVMMEGMKKNMAMMVPQMVMMGWVNYFFSGFILIKLPFPLTFRFKAMLQRGIETADMDVTWVSSLSWYFLNLFGLRGIFGLILGENNAADGMKDMQSMAAPQQQQMGQPQDMSKIFLSERESLDLTVHEWDLTRIEQRMYQQLTGMQSPANKKLQ